MVKKLRILMIAGILAFSTQSAWAEMSISSESIVDGHVAKEQACRKKGGRESSPQLTVSGIPAEAKFLSIIVDDPDARPVAGKTWVHWNVINIPVEGSSFSIAAGEKPASGVVGKQSGGSGYGGMCPPNGKHTYRFVAFAHSSEVPAKTSGWSGKAYTVERFRDDFSDAVIGEASVTGDYK